MVYALLTLTLARHPRYTIPMAIDLLPPPWGEGREVRESSGSASVEPLGTPLGMPASQPSKYSPVRLLTDAEIATLEPIFREQGAVLPDPAISCIVGVVEDEKVVAFIVLQLKLHAQPVWIEQGKSGLFESLVHGAEKIILERTGPQRVYLFTLEGRLTEMAVAMGMQVEPWVVSSKYVAQPAGGTDGRN